MSQPLYKKEVTLKNEPEIIPNHHAISAAEQQASRIPLPIYPRHMAVFRRRIDTGPANNIWAQHVHITQGQVVYKLPDIELILMGNKIPNWKAGRMTGQYHQSLLDYTTKTIDGESVSLSQYKTDEGALLVVNVASKCGLTRSYLPQFAEIQKKMKDTFGENKFEILAFPCGQFAGQEYGNAAETKEFFAKNGAQFKLFERVEVNGPHTSPIFQFLKFNTPELKTVNTNGISLSAIGWNYGKFLVDRDGYVVKYYGPKVNPNECEDDIIKVIKGELKGSAVAMSPDLNIHMEDDLPESTESKTCTRNK